MSPKLVAEHLIPAALAVLPPGMDSREARALVLAICLQESGLRHRRQVHGPAKGLAQFELSGVKEVMTGRLTAAAADKALQELLYSGLGDMEAHSALEHNDVLALAFARLLLWADPKPLPGQDAPDDGWAYYVRRWRPGRPRPATWAQNWSTAWAQTP